MSAFFTLLRNRDVGDWTPIPKNDPWPEEQTMQKAANMKKSYEFILDFFTNPNWPNMFNLYDQNWTDAYQIKKLTRSKNVGDKTVNKRAVQIRVTGERLYELYKSWIKVNKPSFRPVFKNTFYADVEGLHIYRCKDRVKIHNVKRVCVDIYSELVQAEIEKLYAGFQQGGWPTDDDFSSFVSQLGSDPQHP